MLQIHKVKPDPLTTEYISNERKQAKERGGKDVEVSWPGLTVLPGYNANSAAGDRAAGKDPGWRPGQILQGTVLNQAAGDLFIVNLDGRDVLVQSPCLLIKDQAVAVEVHGREGGRYMVRLLNYGTPGEDDAIRSLVRQLGIEDIPLNHSLIRGFLARELPLKPGLLNQAARMLHMLGGNLPENIDTVLLLLKWGVPPKPGVLEVMRAFITGLGAAERGSESQLAGLMRRLAGIWEESPAEGRPQGTGNPAPGRPESFPSLPVSIGGTDLFGQIKEQLQAIIVKPEEGAEKVAAQLRSLLAVQLPRSVQPGGELLSPGGAAPPAIQEELAPAPAAAAIPSKDGLNPGAASGMPAVLPGSGDAADGLEDARKSAESPRGMSDGQNPGTAVSGREIVAEVHVKRLRVFGELLGKFGSLLREVGEAAKEAGGLPGGRSIVQEGTAIERQMAGHQIFQGLEQKSHQESYLYFNLPFIQNGDTETWGQLRIMKGHGGRKLIDPKNFSTAILLHMANLGTLFMELKIRNKYVAANGKVTEDWVANILKNSWPDLQGSFEAMGYHLRPCDWKVGPFEANLRPGEADKQRTSSGLRFLDVTV